jgi:mannosyl-oligosaccharide alpha-1,2-mannosidase
LTETNGEGWLIIGIQTWDEGSDSYFEYLIKYSQLSSTNGITFANSWLTAVDSSINTLIKSVNHHIKHLLLLTTEKTSTVGNHVYLASMDDQGLIRHVGTQLACFYAGNWLLGKFENAFRSSPSQDRTCFLCSGGKLANNDTIVNYALQLNDACWNTFAGTAYVVSFISIRRYSY